MALIMFPHIYPSVEYWTSFIPDTGSTTTFLKIDEIGSTLEPNSILYLSDYQIIRLIFFVI